MARVVRTLNFPPLLVSQVASGLDPYGEWAEVARFPATSAPSTPNGSRDYVVVITGKVGNFENLIGFNGQACVEVALRTSNGVQLQDNFIHRVSLNVDTYHSPRNQAQPFMFIVRRAAWPTGEDLVVIGRTAKYGDSIVTSPRFYVFELAMQCWDTTALGSSRYQWDSSQALAGVTLPVLPSAPLDLGLSPALPWTTGTEQWLVFTTTRYRPRSLVDLVNLYWGTFLGGWGSPTNVWGLDKHGAVCRGNNNPYPPNFNSIYPNEYHHGLITVLSVSANNIRIGQRGICLYPAGAPAGQWVRLDHFSVRLTGLYGLDVTMPTNRSRFYGSREVAPTELLRDYTIGEQRPCSIVAGALPGNRADGYEMDRAFQLKVQVNDGAFYPKGSDVYVPQKWTQQGYAEGQPDLKMFAVDLPDGAVHLRCFGQVNPLDDVTSIIISGISQNTPAGTVFTGSTSGAQAKTLEQMGPWSVQSVKVQMLTTQAFVPLETLTGNGQSPLPKYQGQYPPYVGIGAFLVAFADHDDANLYPPDIAPIKGAEIAIVPSSAGLTLSGLARIPLLPSHPVTWSYDRHETVLEALRGDRMTLPRFLKPKATSSWTYQSLTTAERNTMLGFLGANRYWAAQLPGDPERAYACVRSTLAAPGLGAGLWSLSFDVVQLEVAP